jgi:hypothetical protein
LSIDLARCLADVVFNSLIALAGMIFCFYHPGFAFEKIFKDREVGEQSELEVIKYEAVPPLGLARDNAGVLQNEMGYDNHRS